MRMTHLLAFAAPLALLLPLSAQADNWPAGAKKEYMTDCVAAASKSTDVKTATQHCECGADKLDKTFTASELKELMSKTKQPNEALRTKALDAIQVCVVKK